MCIHDSCINACKNDVKKFRIWFSENLINLKKNEHMPAIFIKILK